MTIARKHQVCIDNTPFYHVYGRCVRRAFLCGADPVSGNDYAHRRQWIVDRIGLLEQAFAIDILSYAIMSNHYHIVVKLCPEQSLAWSDAQISKRWEMLYGIPSLIAKWLNNTCAASEEAVAKAMIEERRERLGNLSWFMKCLNELIARRANQEDHCTGAFWEQRFKSSALLDESALLTGMVYADLNPIRAGIATTLETSDYTSIQARIQLTNAVNLALFQDQVAEDASNQAIAFNYTDYLELVDWTGRIQRDDKRGIIAKDLPPILHRIGFDQHRWINAMALHYRRYTRVGAPDRIRTIAERLSKQWFRGIGEMGLFEKN